MCIIAAKPAGVSMPDHATLSRMWDNNPDGAGLMYVDKSTCKGKTRNRVIIEKGFMEFSDFEKAINDLGRRLDLKDIPVVLHFRITTHGGTCPELTHPFPVSSTTATLKKPRSTADIGIAHNGIITSVSPGKGMSDTAEYVRSQLAPLTRALPNWYENAAALELVKNAIGSKMAVLSATGKLVTIGQFTEDSGILYSNDTFRYHKYTFGYGCYGGWDVYSGDASPWNSSYPRKLMHLASTEGAYVLLSGGEMSDDTMGEYAIDQAGRVYSYDEWMDGYVRLGGAFAYNVQGTSLRFRDKYATWEDTYSEEDALRFYEDLCSDESEEGDPLPEKN